MPNEFNGLGLSFQYPDNWKLDDSDALLGRKSITVYSPGGAFWSIAIHSSSSAPAKLAKAVLDALRSEYGGLEADEVVETLADRELVGYDMAFCCLDLTNTAQVRGFQVGGSSYIIFCQAEDRDFDQIQAVFKAMTVALLRNLNDLEETD